MTQKLLSNKLFCCEIVHKNVPMMAPPCKRGYPYDSSALYTFESLVRFQIAVTCFMACISKYGVCQGFWYLAVSSLLLLFSKGVWMSIHIWVHIIYRRWLVTNWGMFC